MKEHLLITLESSKTYTLAVAGLMPEKGYNFKPADPVWNFGELLHHIAYGIQWWEDNCIKGEKAAWNPPPSKTSKSEIIAYLNKAYASLKETISAEKLTDDKINGFHSTLDHITHHRGQAVLYLRCNGITPPEYSY